MCPCVARLPTQHATVFETGAGREPVLASGATPPRGAVPFAPLTPHRRRDTSVRRSTLLSPPSTSLARRPSLRPPPLYSPSLPPLLDSLSRLLLAALLHTLLAALLHALFAYSTPSARHLASRF